jgi:hypothetical protein
MKARFMVYFLVFILSVAFVSNSYSQNKIDRITKSSTVFLQDNQNKLPTTVKMMNFGLTLLPGFSSGDYIIGPEQLTTLTGWYDYLTNGDNRHWILMDPTDPNKLHVHYCVSDSSNPTGSSSRRTVYAYSSDAGTTWNYGTEVPSVRSGFGYMDLKSDGCAVLSNHSEVSGTINTNLYVDAFAQLGSFTQYLTPLTHGRGVWGQAHVMTNGNIIMVGSGHDGTTSTDTLKYSIFNGASCTQWDYLYYPYCGGTTPNVRWQSASGINGNVVVVYNPLAETAYIGNNAIYSMKSTDNGTTWSTPATIFQPFVSGGLDTVAPYLSMDVQFKPNTTDYYTVFNATGNNLFKKAQLYISKNGGTAHLIADSNTVPNTRTMALTYSNHIGIDYPSVGFSADGQVIYCAFSVMTADTGVSGWNTRDIYYSYSTDDGVTWAHAIQVTSTPLIDEGYPSVSLVNPGTSPETYVLHMVYMKDPGAGPSSFNGSGNPLAPYTRNWQIYRKITQPTVGIRNINSLASNYSLSQNFPNPFNPTTNIKFSIQKAGFVSLKIYDLSGRVVSTLVNEKLTVGAYEYSFNGANLSSGVYFYTIIADGYTATKKMMLIK